MYYPKDIFHKEMHFTFFSIFIHKFCWVFFISENKFCYETPFFGHECFGALCGSRLWCHSIFCADLHDGTSARASVDGLTGLRHLHLGHQHHDLQQTADWTQERIDGPLSGHQASTQQVGGVFLSSPVVKMLLMLHPDLLRRPFFWTPVSMRTPAAATGPSYSGTLQVLQSRNSSTSPVTDSPPFRFMTVCCGVVSTFT